MKHRLSRMLGFTMIELLVVIAVIGVLAVAVLSAINPLEQINKGRDTRTRSDAAEMLNAIDRYYTTQELFPWNKTRVAPNAYTAVAASDTPAEGFLVQPAAAAGSWNWVANMSDVDEVKSAFTQRMVVTSNPMLIYKGGGSATSPVTVCFIPTSSQFKLEAARKCCSAANCPNDPLATTTTAGNQTINGVTFNLCPNVTGSVVVGTDDYICLP